MNSRNNKEQSKQKNKNDRFENLKSDHFLDRLFSYMKKNRSLEIMKINKELQKRLHLSINSYKEYSQLYTPIEIELTLENDKFGKFINIPKDEKEYFHIYFDNSSEEIKRNKLNKNEKVNTIKIIIDHQVKSFKDLFCFCDCISSINFKKFYRTNITNMSGMFYGCDSLKKLNLSNFNTNEVTDMSNMFAGCESLPELNLSNFNTDKLTNMNNMFSQCSLLKELNLSNFNTINVKDMNSMFYHCRSLTELNISSFKINDETKMDHMFVGCSEELKEKIKEQNQNIEI